MFVKIKIWYDMIWYDFWKDVKNPPECLCQSHTILSCEKINKEDTLNSASLEVYIVFVCLFFKSK